jgi:hypothetical protein
MDDFTLQSYLSTAAKGQKPLLSDVRSMNARRHAF